jgi:hypothetical protein
MGDPPEPDRRFSLVGLMIEVKQPESLLHEDPPSSRPPSTLTIQMTTIPATISVRPDGSELAATANSGLKTKPFAGQLIGVFSATNPIEAKIASMIVKANPRVWNECLQAGTGFILVGPITAACQVNGLNSPVRGEAFSG